MGFVLRERPSIYTVGGALGEGADETDRVQYAINKMRDGGRELSVDPEGIYGISQTLILTNAAFGQRPIRIFNPGPKGALLAAINNNDYRATFRRLTGFAGPLMYALGRGVELDGIVLDGAGLPGHLLQVDRGFEFKLARMRFLNAIGYGLQGLALSNTTLLEVFFDQVGYTNSCSDAAIAAGSAVLTSASASFGPQDIGAIFIVPGAGSAGGLHVSRAVSFQDAHTITLKATAGSTVSGATATWDAAARRYSGNSAYEYTTNTLIEIATHAERCRGIALDLGYGNDIDDYFEFGKFTAHHDEATTAGGTVGSLSTRPQIRVGNIRGLDLFVPFIYGGSGPLIQYDKLRDAGASKMTGLTITGGNMLGYVENHAVVAGKTPDRLIDLVRGDDVAIIGLEMDTALSEHIRIRSTFGPNVALVGVKHKTRAGAATQYVVDDRVVGEATRKPASILGWLAEAWCYIYMKAAAAILFISSDEGYTAQVRFRMANITRFDWGLSPAGNMALTWRDPATAANKGDVLTVDKTTGALSLLNPFRAYTAQGRSGATLASDTGFAANHLYEIGGFNRWESGANSAGNFAIKRRDAAGSDQGDPIAVDAITGKVSIGAGGSSTGTRIRFNTDTGTVAPAAGGAGAVPATPAGYANIEVNGTVRKFAFY